MKFKSHEEVFCSQKPARKLQIVPQLWIEMHEKYIWQLKNTQCDNGIVSLGCNENAVTYAVSKVKMLVRAKLQVSLSWCSVFQGHENSRFSCTRAN